MKTLMAMHKALQLRDDINRLKEKEEDICQYWWFCWYDNPATW